MTNTIVGDSNCSIEAVRDAMTEYEGSSDILLLRWQVLAWELEVPPTEIDNLNKRYYAEKEDFNSVLARLLETWRANLGKRAELSKLIAALEKLNLNLIAESLRKKFISGGSPAVNIPLIQTQTVTLHAVDSPNRESYHQTEVWVEDQPVVLRSKTKSRKLFQGKMTFAAVNKKVVLSIFAIIIIIVLVGIGFSVLRRFT